MSTLWFQQGNAMVLWARGGDWTRQRRSAYHAGMKRSPFHTTGQRGFTLIEVLIAVAITGILLGASHVLTVHRVKGEVALSEERLEVHRYAGDRLREAQSLPDAGFADLARVGREEELPLPLRGWSLTQVADGNWGVQYVDVAVTYVNRRGVEQRYALRGVRP